MDTRTFSYLSGRFRDYYRSTEITLPPEADAREWGYIPFDESGDIYMVRHKSLGELGQIDQFTKREHPRHFYFSSSKYRDPGIKKMNEKGWQSADLIFDIDADHLSNVDEAATPYDEMLEEGKIMLQKLLNVLQNDFAFDDVEVVFSGGRGYHVHIRDSSVQNLSRSARNEIVDYITGTNVNFDDIVTSSLFEIPTIHQGKFPQSAGWGQKYLEYFRDTISNMRTDVLQLYEEKTEDEAVSESVRLLQDEYEISNIGEERIKSVIEVFKNEDQFKEVKLGNVDINSEIRIIAKQILEQTINETGVEIDEPVTTDTNRLIRLPGSLHGGSGLQVTRIPLDEINAFNPLVDAIPSAFSNNTVRIKVEENVDCFVGGEKTVYEEGEHSIPEYEAIHLLCREDAEKIPE